MIRTGGRPGLNSASKPSGQKIKDNDINQEGKDQDLALVGGDKVIGSVDQHRDQEAL